jgi:hypothetical protein
MKVSKTDQEVLAKARQIQLTLVSWEPLDCLNVLTMLVSFYVKKVVPEKRKLLIDAIVETMRKYME